MHYHMYVAFRSKVRGTRMQECMTAEARFRHKRTLPYKATNTNITTGALYNQTYAQTVDETITGSANNSVEVTHTSGELYSDVVVTCTLDYNQPAGQDTLDTSVDMNGTYVFDELALYTANSTMLTHVIFHPVQKSANRKIQVIYTLRIRTSYSDV